LFAFAVANIAQKINLQNNFEGRVAKK